MGLVARPEMPSCGSAWWGAESLDRVGQKKAWLGLDAVAMLLQWLAVFRQILMGMAPTAPFQAGHGMARPPVDLARHKKTARH